MFLRSFLVELSYINQLNKGLFQKKDKLYQPCFYVCQESCYLKFCCLHRLQWQLQELNWMNWEGFTISSHDQTPFLPTGKHKARHQRENEVSLHKIFRWTLKELHSTWMATLGACVTELQMLPNVLQTIKDTWFTLQCPPPRHWHRHAASHMFRLHSGHRSTDDATSPTLCWDKGFSVWQKLECH